MSESGESGGMLIYSLRTAEIPCFNLKVPSITMENVEKAEKEQSSALFIQTGGARLPL